MTTAGRRSASSLATESYAFLPIAQGRIRIAIWLLSICTAPFAEKAISESQRFRLHAIAFAVALPSGKLSIASFNYSWVL